MLFGEPRLMFIRVNYGVYSAAISCGTRPDSNRCSTTVRRLAVPFVAIHIFNSSRILWLGTKTVTESPRLICDLHSH
jgi:hypothetical protein